MTNAESLADKVERLVEEMMEDDQRKRDGAPPPDPFDDYTPDDSDDPRAPSRGAKAKANREPPKEAAQPSVFEQRWITLSDSLDWLTEEPPPQQWLLKRWHERRDHGVFPRGRTGVLTATGGVGKTYTLIQLALAVAGGGFWLDTFRAVEAGHVCLALAEEASAATKP